MPKRLLLLLLYCCFIVQYIQWIVWIDKWYICLYSLLETLAAGAVTDWNKTNVRGLFFECIFFFIVLLRIYWHLFNFQQMLLAESVLHHRNENCGNVFRYTIERYVHVSWKKKAECEWKMIGISHCRRVQTTWDYSYIYNMYSMEIEFRRLRWLLWSTITTSHMCAASIKVRPQTSHKIHMFFSSLLSNYKI